jgi:hypothetical protein
MNIKKFLICPTCQKNGLFKPLGELDDQGRLVIKRRLDYTIIEGESYNVLCGNCGEIVFVRRIGERREDEKLNFGSIGIYRETFIGTIIQAESSGGSSTSGTII